MPACSVAAAVAAAAAAPAGSQTGWQGRQHHQLLAVAAAAEWHWGRGQLRWWGRTAGQDGAGKPAGHPEEEEQPEEQLLEEQEERPEEQQEGRPDPWLA